MKTAIAIIGVMLCIFGVIWLTSTSTPPTKTSSTSSASPEPKKPDVQYGDTIAANVDTVGCDTEEELSGTRRNCIFIKMASTGKAIKTYGKVGTCVRWQGRESGCLWSPRSELLFIPADKVN